MSSISSSAGSQHRDGVTFISSIQSSGRRICSITRGNLTTVGESAAFELDSHADTSVLGKHFAVLEYTITSCDVYGFSSTTKLTDIPIVSGAFAWDDVNDITHIQVIHHAL